MRDVAKEEADNAGKDSGTPRPAGSGSAPLFGGGGQVAPGGLQPSPPVTPQDGPTSVPTGGTPQPKRP